MDKVEREQLKHDRFVEEVGHSVEFVASHRKQFGLYVGLGVALLALGLGFWYWRGQQAEVRQADLKEALKIQEASIGEGSNPYLKTFRTQADKDAAAITAFNGMIAKHGGSDEATVAFYWLGVIYADQGKYAEAEKNLKTAIDGGNKEYASLAKFSLALLYGRQDKKADAEKMLRELAASPTYLVSKEQAQIELARLIGTTRPEEARKILEPMRSAPGAVSRWAVTAYGDLKLSETK